MKRRIAYLRALRRRLTVGKPKLHKIYISGVRPAATFGSMITGLTSRELLALRRALMPYRGGSLDGRMLLYGDPAWQASVAPMLQYAKALWRSLVEHHRTLLEVPAEGVGRCDRPVPYLGSGSVEAFCGPHTPSYVVSVTFGLVLHEFQDVQG